MSTPFKALDDSDLIRTPAQKIIANLKELRAGQVLAGAPTETIAQLNYAIDKISTRTIYEIDMPFLDSLDLNESRTQASVAKGWIHQFSTMGLDILREISLRKSHQERRKSAPDTNIFGVISKPPSINTVQKFETAYDSHLQGLMSVDFNIHNFIKEIGRKSALSVLTVSVMRRLHVFPSPLIDEAVLGSFLGQIYRGYRRDVEYHNDIHAADVLQMFYVMLTQGGLVELAQLNEIDVLSSVIACICHDYDHDGLNNAYHVNAISDRAIRYSDKAVQENWHVAEAFAVLN